MLSIANLLNEEESLIKTFKIVRKKQSSYPPKDTDFEEETVEKTDGDTKVLKKKEVVKDDAGDDVEIEHPTVIIRRKKV